MKKLLISIDFPPLWGGQWIYTYELFKREKYLLFTTKSEWERQVVNSLNNEIQETTYLVFNQLYFILEVFFKYYKNIREENEISVIHSSWIDAILLLIFKQKNIKYITTIHNTYIQRLLSKKHRIIYWLIYPFLILAEKFVVYRSDKVISVSNNTQKYVNLLCNKESNEIIYNGVDTDIFNSKNRDTDSDEVRFLFVWRLEERKWIYKFLEIFSRFLVEYDWTRKIILNIIWKWSDYNKIQDYVEKNNLIDNINLLWFKNHPDEVVPYYNKSDALVLLSKWEGLPLVVLEAISSWVSVLATKDATWSVDWLLKNPETFIVEDDYSIDDVLISMNKIVELKWTKKDNDFMANYKIDRNDVIQKTKQLYH